MVEARAAIGIMTLEEPTVNEGAISEIVVSSLGLTSLRPCQTLLGCPYLDEVAVTSSYPLLAERSVQDECAELARSASIEDIANRVCLPQQRTPIEVQAEGVTNA